MDENKLITFKELKQFMNNLKAKFINETTLQNTQPKLSDDEPYTDSPQDTDTLSNIDLSSNKNKKITFDNLWLWIKGKITSVYYPVGHVIFNTGTNPSSAFGGTWELYSTGTKALYLDRTAETTVSEELPNPNITLNTTGSHSHAYRKENGRNAWNVTPGSYNVGQTQFIDGMTDTKGNHTHTVTIGNSVYKNDGKVRAEGITICAWKRTA